MNIPTIPLSPGVLAQRRINMQVIDIPPPEVNPLDITPAPTIDDLADVVGNNAFFNNLNVNLINGLPPGSGGGLSLPITQVLTFSPDATWDIGTSTDLRPRDIRAGRSIYANGGMTTLPNPNSLPVANTVQGFGVGLAAGDTQCIMLGKTATMWGGGSQQFGIRIQHTWPTSAASSMESIYIQNTIPAALNGTNSAHYGMHLGATSFGGTSQIGNLYGIKIENQGSSINTGIASIITGIRIENQTGGTLSSYALDVWGPMRLGGTIGFQGSAPIAKQTVSGAKAGNTALASLCAALVAYGLISDTSSA